MATRRFDLATDARVGTDGSLNLGAGACNHLAWGDSGSYQYQSLVKLNHDWTDMTDVTNVQLYVRNSNEDHITRGTAGNRQFLCRPVRPTASWSPGTASHPMTSSNAVVWGDIGDAQVNPSYEVGPFGTDDVDDSWNDFSATEMFRYWAPSTITFPGGAGQGNTNGGFRIQRNDASDKGEFWSGNKGDSYAIYAVVTYTNHGDLVVTIDDPIPESTHGAMGSYATPSYTFEGTATCPEGHSITNVTLAFDDAPTVPVPVVSDSSETIVGNDWTNTVADALLTRGTDWYAKATATCSGGVTGTVIMGPFRYAAATVPVITGAADQVMELDIQGTETNPRAWVRWTYSDPAGSPQDEYRAILYADDETTVREDSGWVSSSDTYHRFDTYSGISRLTFYKFTVETRNAYGVSAGVTSMARRKANWGLYNDYKDLGSTPSSWSMGDIGSTLPTNTNIILQHSSSGTSTPGTWRCAFDDVTLAQFYHVRYWLFAWHGATTPTLSTYSIRYSSSTTTPDKYTLAAGASLSTSRFVLGSRSLKMVGNGTTRITYSAAFPVRPETVYSISARAFSVGNSGGLMRVVDSGRVNELATTNALTATTTGQDFEVLEGTTTFLTGASQTTAVAEFIVTGLAGTECYFDCGQVEPGAVITPYKPGSVGRPVVVDMGGLQVDAAAGGTFRLRGSDGAANSVIELGTYGLDAGNLTLREVTAPATPASGKVVIYAKSDGLVYSKDDAGTETVVTGGGGGGGAHSGLTGLTAGDDHTQYLLESLLTTQGDMPYATGASTWTRLAKGTAFQGLRMNSGATAPEWANQDIMLVNTANRTNNTTSLSDITGLTWAIAASEVWSIHACGTYETVATTTGITLSVNGPVAMTPSVWVEVQRVNTADGTDNAVGRRVNALDSVAAGTLSVDAANVLRHWSMVGIVTNGANAGTAALRFASEVGASQVTVHANAWCRIRRIA